eukprot:EG_transcript_31192
MNIVPRPQWPDAKKFAACTQCQQPFSRERGRWNCPACGRVLCKPCSIAAVIPPLGTGFAPVCSSCVATAQAVYGSVQLEKPPTTAPAAAPAILSPDEERELRARLAEERLQLLALRGRPKAAATSPTSPAPVPSSAGWEPPAGSSSSPVGMSADSSTSVSAETSPITSIALPDPPDPTAAASVPSPPPSAAGPPPTAEDQRAAILAA